ncbi:MAG: hypothetical protein RL398_1413 [Planctomycetota bacterium]
MVSDGCPGRFGWRCGGAVAYLWRMLRRLAAVLLPLALLAPLAAQDKPAPNKDTLAPFRPMLGTWTGQGTAMFNVEGEPSKWHGRATFSLCLDGKFVQEDIQLHFEGVPMPIHMRGYLGWDEAHARHAAIVVTSAGEVGLHKVKVLPDGTLLQVMNQEQDGVPYAERSLFKIHGDTMTHEIELLMAQGASVPMVRGAFTRQKADAQPCVVDGSGEPFLGMPPQADIGRLGKVAGSYKTEGEVATAPGQPRMKIAADERFEAWFGGGVVTGLTKGTAVGMPGTYESRAYWAYDKKSESLRCVYVSSMGEIGEMEGWWVGKQLVSVSAGRNAGQPMTQRFVLDFDEQGHAIAGRGHSMVGTADPAETFKATYKRQ